MTNVQTEMKGDKLVITVDCSKKSIENAARSASGKNRVIGSTHGNVAVHGEIKVGLNVFCK